MTIAFYLKAPQRGCPPSKQKATPLVLVVCHRGAKYKKQVGISVRPCEFKNQHTRDETVNVRLRSMENLLRNMLDRDSTPETIKAALERAVCGELSPARTVRKGPTFWEYFQEWAERDDPSIRQRRLAFRNISRLMGQAENWEDIDAAYHYRLVQQMNAAHFALNYRWRTVQQLRTVMNEGLKLKYHGNVDFKSWKNPKETPEAVYLTQEEVDRLWNLDLKDPALCKARDLFVLGVYTAARFSDYSRLSQDMIQDGIIRFVQRKTAGKVLIPASPRVVQILERNGGKAPRISQQTFNEQIKRVCKEAAICDIVEFSHSVGDRRILEQKPKYQLVSSHTARRTGATLLYQSGIPAAQCMMLTGHRKESTFYRYIKTTMEENARLLQAAAFFK